MKTTLNKISLIPIRQKLGNYESFLSNNVDNLQSEHGINLNNKPTFIQSIIQQQQNQALQQNQIFVGAGQANNPQAQYQGIDQQMMSSLNTRMDNSFDAELNPMQQQLQNKFTGDGPLPQGELAMQ